jgi:hypothetical protein
MDVLSNRTLHKIAKMEAKLRELEESSSATPPPLASLHPSLPSKPTFDADTYSSLPQVSSSKTSAQAHYIAPQTSLHGTAGPSMTSMKDIKGVPSRTASTSIAPQVKLGSAAQVTPGQPPKRTTLAGVRIGKSKPAS